MVRIYLGLGTNLGDKENNIAEAVKNIGELIGNVACQSALYVTEPWGFESDNQFLNAVAAVETELSPHELLAATQRIERLMGRRYKSVGGVYHDRIIDIDILLYGRKKINDADLKVPHPLMWERDFVMTPLNELAAVDPYLSSVLATLR